MNRKHDMLFRIEEDSYVLPRVLIENQKVRELADVQVSQQNPTRGIEDKHPLSFWDGILSYDFEALCFDQDVDSLILGLTLTIDQADILDQNRIGTRTLSGMTGYEGQEDQKP